MAICIIEGLSIWIIALIRRHNHKTEHDSIEKSRHFGKERKPNEEKENIP